MMNAGQPLEVEPLTREAFAAFGDVIEADEHRASYPINDGNATRFHDLAVVDASADGGKACVSIVRVKPCDMPMRIRMLERHLRGSQAFVPLGGQRFLVVVAPGGDAPRIDEMRCFLATGGQGVNYRRGTWHHPVMGMDEVSDFLVVDRAADVIDCEKCELSEANARTVNP